VKHAAKSADRVRPATESAQKDPVARFDGLHQERVAVADGASQAIAECQALDRPLTLVRASTIARVRPERP
jgi:hypothetical protein